MVGGCDDHIGIGVDGPDPIGGKSDTGSCVSTLRLQKNLIFLQLRQLLHGELLVNLVGDDENVFDRNDLTKTVEGLLKQGTACSEEIKKLFGVRCPACWPKTASDAAAHYNTVIVVHALLIRWGDIQRYLNHRKDTIFYGFLGASAGAFAATFFVVGVTFLEFFAVASLAFFSAAFAAASF
jgi:hypothetical protein